MKVNRHLIKKGPLYKTTSGRVVKLLKAYKTQDGLCFTAEVMEGPSKGKWTSVNKKDLKLVR